MATREHLLNQLQAIRTEIQGYVTASEKQVDLVNKIRNEELVLEETYDDSGLSHKFLSLTFSVIVFTLLSFLIRDLVLLIFQGSLDYLISDAITIFIFLTVLTYFLYQDIKGKKSKWFRPLLILTVIAFGALPLRFLMSFDPLALIVLVVVGFLTKIVSKKYLYFWIGLVNKKVDGKNQIALKNHQNTVQYNASLRELYRVEGTKMDKHQEAALALGQGWYPKDYYTLHAISYFIHCLENFKADTVKEMVQLYDLEVDRLERRAYESQMIQLQQEQLINQAEMISLLEYQNILTSTQIAVTADAAKRIEKSNQEVKKQLEQMT